MCRCHRGAGHRSEHQIPLTIRTRPRSAHSIGCARSRSFGRSVGSEIRWRALSAAGSLRCSVEFCRVGFLRGVAKQSGERSQSATEWTAARSPCCCCRPGRYVDAGLPVDRRPRRRASAAFSRCARRRVARSSVFDSGVGCGCTSGTQIENCRAVGPGTGHRNVRDCRSPRRVPSPSKTASLASLASSARSFSRKEPTLPPCGLEPIGWVRLRWVMHCSRPAIVRSSIWAEAQRGRSRSHRICERWLSGLCLMSPRRRTVTASAPTAYQAVRLEAA